jgi:hypothetical protein
LKSLSADTEHIVCIWTWAWLRGCLALTISRRLLHCRLTLLEKVIMGEAQILFKAYIVCSRKSCLSPLDCARLWQLWSPSRAFMRRYKGRGCMESFIQSRFWTSFGRMRSIPMGTLLPLPC